MPVAQVLGIKSMNQATNKRPARLEPGVKMTAAEKMARIPVKIEPTATPLRKPPWIRVRAPVSPEVARLKKTLRENHLHTVCEEASCPNLAECFGKGTATYIIEIVLCVIKGDPGRGIEAVSVPTRAHFRFHVHPAAGDADIPIKDYVFACQTVIQAIFFIQPFPATD